MEKESVVHSFDGKAAPGVSATRKPGNTHVHSSMINKKSLTIFVGVIVLGVLSGYIISILTKTKTVAVTSSTNVATLPKGTAFGSDASVFKDSAQGILRKGGIDGEGAYHLERPGGISQNVYLTSSVLDLSQLVGRNIKVWGQTNAAQKAGWLMDVGRAEIVN